MSDPGFFVTSCHLHFHAALFQTIRTIRELRERRNWQRVSVMRKGKQRQRCISSASGHGSGTYIVTPTTYIATHSNLCFLNTATTKVTRCV